MSYDMNIHSKPDAQAWARLFISMIEEQSLRLEDIDESLMIGWFANAMMAMHDHIKSQRTWVGLTDEETQTCWDKAVNTIAPQYSIVRAIEAKLKQKNGFAEEKNT